MGVKLMRGPESFRGGEYDDDESVLSVWSLSVEASYAFRVLEVPSVSCREMGRLECVREPSAV